ncbi:Gfo/Idh/MocA family protein [Planctomicrobium sp. SH527]|uniref:Gfo/Idh/MocA family protein n=1 Tax=Planctomicrobium sp. SH527 TaxID=3448123 RepID=UPI003F5BDC9C
MSVPSRIRIALVGCGQIADAHLAQLLKIRSAEVVAVCDVQEDLAWQAARRFGIPQYFTSMERMLDKTQPDVVHVTTPAHTHASLAIQLVNAGVHVYLEKPFTLNAIEASQVLAAADVNQRFVCVGHDQLFDPVWLKAKQWIERGLIGPVRHVESILGYPIDGKYGSLVSANPDHWVRKLPGGLFQNTISHPLYRITDLLEDEQPAIIGGWRARGSFPLPTELSVSFQGERQTGSLTFSTLMPPVRITRIYGTKGYLDIDFDAQTVRFLRLAKLPGAFAKLESPWQQFLSSVWNLANNVTRFARADIHYFAGMKTLFERFYAAIRGEGEMPIPHEEAYRVTLLLDRIVAHCENADRLTNDDAASQRDHQFSC